MNHRIVLASQSPRRRELIRMLGLDVEIMPADVDETVDESLHPSQVVVELAIRKAQTVKHKSGAHKDRSTYYSTEDREEGGQTARDNIISVGSDTIVVLNGHILGKPESPEDAVRMLRQLQGKTHEVYTGVACVRIGQTKRQEIQTGISQEAQQNSLQEVRRDSQQNNLQEPHKASQQNSLQEVQQTFQQNSQDSLQHAGHQTGKSDSVFNFGNIGQYQVFSREEDGRPSVIAGYTVSKVTFRPMSDEEINAYVKTGEPLDKAGSYGVQGTGSIFIEKIDGDFYSIMGLPLNLLYQILLQFQINPLSNI